MTVDLSIAVVVLRGCSRFDQPIAEALMVSLRMVVGGMLGHDTAQVPFAEQHYLVEALAPNRADKALGVSIGTSCRLHRAHSAGGSKYKDFFRSLCAFLDA